MIKISDINVRCRKIISCRDIAALFRQLLRYIDATYRKHPQTYSRVRIMRFYERSATSRKSFERDEILSRLGGSSFSIEGGKGSDGPRG